MAWRVALAALIASVALYLFGRYIFILFGITADAFRIGAGSVLFISALGMAQVARRCRATTCSRT